METTDEKLVRSFDLTTKAGRKVVQNFLDFTPIGIVIKGVDWLVKKHQEGLDLQKNIACDLIKKGKVEGVDKMEIKLNNTKGFSIDVPIEGVNISTKLSADDSIVVNVEYKK